ncbi:putative sporulation protein YtxC [Oceanobacillus piezotolerans]|uniref:Putative sporulation protein YtxC n=1 Tax=Oceanobacillus piezotolerans TaxID=2448030 RepID=A0A498D9W6_9BACI|nr:sporulation protein YtxC [Oceanobacillus piezotolerans]RLL47904.1 putative sporulation protein YtxC [Oceanobacillus piezotolerans]
MLEAYFGSDKEVLRFCEYLFGKSNQIQLHWKLHEEWGNHIQIEENIPSKQLKELMANAMAHVFMENRLGNMIRSTIKKYYYYRDTDEIERIYEIANWIITGEDDSSIQIRKTKKDEPSQLLVSLFIANMKSTRIFHYDSIIKFGLGVFKDYLIHYIGLAIDEFKREEDHQEFVNMLRNYISKKQPKIPMIHILQGSHFTFYKESGKMFSALELRTIMQNEPLYIVGLDEDEMNLAPLIAMSPQQIKIYGDDPSEAKTLTVINVFQERVTFESANHFPFQYYYKNEQ